MRGFDPKHPDFFDRDDLDREMDRINDICHGCRLCFNLCPSFPALFDAMDENEYEHASELTAAERWRVVDLCYNCKLCFPKCPYIPPHEYELDFPALMLRAKAVRAKHEGLTTQDRFLGNPGLVGKIGGIAPKLTNAVNTPGSLPRKMLELTMGIAAERKLPPIAEETFSAWFARRGPSRPREDAPPQGTVALFHTCSVEQHWPGTGKALVEVLEHNGFEVVIPDQKCCGMPALDGGDIETARAWGLTNLEALHAAVEAGQEIVVPGPSCSLMIRKDYPELLGDDRAKVVAEHTHDAGEFLWKLHKEERLVEEFVWRPESVAYHQPCHLKVQNIGVPAQRLMKLLGAKVTIVDLCSGMDGTWGMKKEYYELSSKQAKKLVGRIESAGAELTASDCSMAALQVEDAGAPRPLHPIEILHRAYGLAREE
ncbi:MAG: heterodisulfide reductase-related iron-sulfur binding cluster [Deltaproteobacteria bacterium]|nr:heterodisulfide reductase-related iron-sulfur binding cluster [Deltaproteobacteria bacterium]